MKKPLLFRNSFDEEEEKKEGFQMYSPARVTPRHFTMVNGGGERKKTTKNVMKMQ